MASSDLETNNNWLRTPSEREELLNGMRRLRLQINRLRQRHKLGELSLAGAIHTCERQLDVLADRWKRIADQE